jgi:outer membrane protein assembly factor BamB
LRTQRDWQAGHYCCLDEETGELLWTFTEEQTGSWGVGYTQGVPAYEDGKFYLTTWLYIGGNVYCIDADTGAEIWHQTTPLDACGSPAVVDGTVYVTNYDFFGYGAIYAMDAGNGDILWNYTIQRTDSTPAVAYGNVYVTGGAKGFSDVQTYCFNATTGDLVWETNTSDKIGAWTCSVAVADGKVFVGTEGGWFDYAGTYALDAFTGGVIWSYPAGGASPAVADGTVFTIGGGRVYAFGGSKIPAGVTFDLKKLNLNSSGILKAFITLPEDYNVTDINVSTVECEGAHAFGDGSVITGKQALEVKFKIQDLVDVPTGDAILLTVTGELTTGERFEGSNTVEVIAK